MCVCITVYLGDPKDAHDNGYIDACLHAYNNAFWDASVHAYKTGRKYAYILGTDALLYMPLLMAV
jgi:hypothetical protein